MDFFDTVQKAMKYKMHPKTYCMFLKRKTLISVQVLKLRLCCNATNDEARRRPPNMRRSVLRPMNYDLVWPTPKGLLALMHHKIDAFAALGLANAQKHARALWRHKCFFEGIHQPE